MKNLDDIHNDIWDLRDEVRAGKLSPIQTAEILLTIYGDIQKAINFQNQIRGFPSSCQFSFLS